jgi:FHA domain
VHSASPSPHVVGSERRPSRCAPRWLSLLSLLVAAIAGPGSLEVTSQVPITRVEEIRLDPQAHANEIRTVEGVVDRLVSRAGATSPAFYLEDDFGHQILVIPFETAPQRGSRLVVTGVVTLDSGGDPVLTVFDSAGLRAAEVASEDDVADEDEPSLEGVATPAAANETAVSLRRWPSTWMLVVGVGVLAVLGVIVFNLGRGSADTTRPLVTGPTTSQDVDFATSALWPESEQEFDGRTMRFSRPDPTMQVMPVRLEVIGGGDTGEVVHFVGVPGAPIEMMLGRSPGLGPSNVQLKQKTVSRTHAIIRHRHNEWLIENLSMTNPTVLNDEVLGVKERLLTDGDRIEMGEVIFRFAVS